LSAPEPESQLSFDGSSCCGPSKVASGIDSGAQLKSVPAQVPPETVDIQPKVSSNPREASPRSCPIAAESDREPPPEMHSPAHGGPSPPTSAVTSGSSSAVLGSGNSEAFNVFGTASSRSVIRLPFPVRRGRRADVESRWRGTTGPAR